MVRRVTEEKTAVNESETRDPNRTSSLHDSKLPHTRSRVLALEPDNYQRKFTTYTTPPRTFRDVGEKHSAYCHALPYHLDTLLDHSSLRRPRSIPLISYTEDPEGVELYLHIKTVPRLIDPLLMRRIALIALSLSPHSYEGHLAKYSDNISEKLQSNYFAAFESEAKRYIKMLQGFSLEKVLSIDKSNHLKPLSNYHLAPLLLEIVEECSQEQLPKDRGTNKHHQTIARFFARQFEEYIRKLLVNALTLNDLIDAHKKNSTLCLPGLLVSLHILKPVEWLTPSFHYFMNRIPYFLELTPSPDEYEANKLWIKVNQRATRQRSEEIATPLLTAPIPLEEGSETVPSIDKSSHRLSLQALRDLRFQQCNYDERYCFAVSNRLYNKPLGQDEVEIDTAKQLLAELILRIRPPEWVHEAAAATCYNYCIREFNGIGHTGYYSPDDSKRLRAILIGQLLLSPNIFRNFLHSTYELMVAEGVESDERYEECAKLLSPYFKKESFLDYNETISMFIRDISELQQNYLCSYFSADAYLRAHEKRCLPFELACFLDMSYPIPPWEWEEQLTILNLCTTKSSERAKRFL